MCSGTEVADLASLAGLTGLYVVLPQLKKSTAVSQQQSYVSEPASRRHASQVVGELESPGSADCVAEPLLQHTVP